MSRLDAATPHDATDRWHPSALLGPRSLLALVAFLAAVGVGALADAAKEHEGLNRLDPVTAADVLTWRTPMLTHLARILTFMGSEVAVGGLAISALVILLARRRLTRAAVFAIAMGGSAFLTVAVKLLVARPRPGGVDRLGPLDTTYSFPSGHTLNSMVFLALVVWLLWPSVRYAGHVALVVLVACAAVLAVGVAASRIYLGYHWLTDVLASGLVAIAWLCLVGLAGSTMTRAISARAERGPTR